MHDSLHVARAVQTSPPARAGPVASSPSSDEALEEILGHLFAKYAVHRAGAPLPPTADADVFAVSVASVDGRQIGLGDVDRGFPLQSIAKPFVYGAALEAQGRRSVLARLGVEPTGRAFDSVLESDQVSARRYNPMVNVGALVASAMVNGASLAERRRRILGTLSRYAGRTLRVDRATLEDRRTNDHRNRALAHLMIAEGVLREPAEQVVETYFRQCSVRVTTADLAWMAATVANGGRHPRTGDRALPSRYVTDVLSVMFFCGLYEFSGQWAYRVGLPAAGSLSGALLAVVPGRMGVAVFSPRLGVHRKSERGVLLIEELAEHLRLHVFSSDASPEVPRTAVARSSSRRRVVSLARARAARRPPALASLLGRVFEAHPETPQGTVYVADPRLEPPDSRAFGVCVATTSGEIHGRGDFETPLLMQSISKVLAYGMALEDCGRERVLQSVDVEPSGVAYNSVIQVRESSKRAHNPMVNAGGIATTSLIWGEGPAHRLERVLRACARYVGHGVSLDTPAFLAEQAANDRNRAIAHLLRHFGMLEGEIDAAMNLYLQQCSIQVTCRDLALFGATLANQGVHPGTGERALERRYVRDLLGVMYTCGMYDYAGQWGHTVGLPAKSGVGGAIMGVVPGRMGIAVYSPPLDDRGNSIRGIRVFADLARALGVHALRAPTSRVPKAGKRRA